VAMSIERWTPVDGSRRSKVVTAARTGTGAAYASLEGTRREDVPGVQGKV